MMPGLRDILARLRRRPARSFADQDNRNALLARLNDLAPKEKDPV